MTWDVRTCDSTKRNGLNPVMLNSSCVSFIDSCHIVHLDACGCRAVPVSCRMFNKYMFIPYIDKGYRIMRLHIRASGRSVCL